MGARVTTRGMAHGGEAVGSLEDGKTVFVAGGLPDEEVLVGDLVDRGSWARGRLERVERASPSRIEAPCPYFGDCGGCQWQHAEYAAQLEFKRSIVAGQLRHLAQMPDADVRPTLAPGPPYGYRNKMRFHVALGRPGQYRAGSHTVVPADQCMLLVSALADLYQRLGPLPDVREIVLRHGVNTGESLVIIKGAIPQQAAEWGVPVARWRRNRIEGVIGPDHLHETVAGVRFRITGMAFFQVNTWAAEALVSLVADALQPEPDDVLLDAYAGGGLFAVTAGASVRRVIAVETAGPAIDDLRHNLESAGIRHADVVDGRVEKALGRPLDGWDLVVADPPRAGLGPDAIDAIVAPEPRALAYVSCDPASFARDARLLAQRGYTLDWVVPVDQFPQTYHLELVGRFHRADPADPTG